MQFGGSVNLRVLRSGRIAAVSRELWFPSAFVAQVFGPGVAEAAVFGPEADRVRRSSRGSRSPGRDASAAIRGWKASSGVIHPAPEAGLPCRSQLKDGRCRSNFDTALSGDGRSPSPVSGSWPVRDRTGSPGDLCDGFTGQERFPRGAFGGPEDGSRKRRSSGDPMTGACLAQSPVRRGIPRGSARALERTTGPPARLCLQEEGLDRTSERRATRTVRPTG